MKIRVWVEVMTTERFIEEIHETPNDWELMTSSEREDYMGSLFDELRNEIANGGYETVDSERTDG